jgi:phage antirepressor YoqD-like protein
LFEPVEKTMTTKELAETLGVDISTVKKTVSRLEASGDVLHHLTRDKYNNQCFLFDEKQATFIKQEIQKHHNLASREIDSVSTEKTMTVKEVAEFFKVAESTIRNIVGRHGWAKNGVQTKLNEEQVTIISREMKTNSSMGHQKDSTLLVTSKVATKLEVLENYKKATEAFVEMLTAEKEEYRLRAEKAESVVNRIADSTGLKTIKEVADILGYGEKTYFAMLRGMDILFKDNGINLPKRQYIDSGYFEVKEEPYERNGKTFLYSRIYVTAKGLLWLEKKTPKRVDCA